MHNRTKTICISVWPSGAINIVGLRSLQEGKKVYGIVVDELKRIKVSKASMELRAIEVGKTDAHAGHYSMLKPRIKELLANYGATEEEIDQVYNHILNDVISEK